MAAATGTALAQLQSGHGGWYSEGDVGLGDVEAWVVAEVLLHHLGIAEVPAADVGAVPEVVLVSLVLLHLVLQRFSV